MRKIYSLLLLGGLLLLGVESVWAHTVTIKVKVASSDDNYYLYAWNINNTSTHYNGDWNSEGNSSSYSNGEYTYSLTVGNDEKLGLIFRSTNRSSQSFDICAGVITGNVTLSYDLSEGVTGIWSLKGSFDGWNDHVVLASSKQVSVYLTAGSTYEFGIQTSDGYYAAGNSWENVTMTSENTNNNWWGAFVKTDYQNLKVTPTITGDYTFVFDGSSKYGTFIYPVQLSADGYATLYSFNEVAIPDGVEAYYQSSHTPDPLDGTAVTVNFTKLVNYIPEKTPVILKGTASSVHGFTYTTSGASVSEDGMFKGVQSTTEYASLAKGSEDYVYVLAGTGASFGFHQLASTGHVNASRCYLVIPEANGPATAPAVSMWLEDENGATAIPVFGAEENVKDNAIYTILGQRVNNMSAPGIYIQNGKKFIVK